jgi:hypothetical protein
MNLAIEKNLKFVTFHFRSVYGFPKRTVFGVAGNTAVGFYQIVIFTLSTCHNVEFSQILRFPELSSKWLYSFARLFNNHLTLRVTALSMTGSSQLLNHSSL